MPGLPRCWIAAKVGGLTLSAPDQVLAPATQDETPPTMGVVKAGYSLKMLRQAVSGCSNWFANSKRSEAKARSCSALVKRNAGSCAACSLDTS